MIFSKACEYAIRATIYIAKQSIIGKRSNLKDIAKEIDSPVAFTAKTLQILVHHNILHSVKGAMGGFEIKMDQLNKIRLVDIVVAIDGKGFDKICVLGMKKCSEIKPCPVHHKFKEIKKDMIEMMNNTNLLELSKGLNEGFTFLKI